MLKNYLKTAFRNLTKHKSFTIINMIGLPIGLSTLEPSDHNRADRTRVRIDPVGERVPGMARIIDGREHEAVPVGKASIKSCPNKPIPRQPCF
jgi:hypothetical protein